MASDPVVHRSIATGIVTITLDSPRNRNALSTALVGQLTDSLRAAAIDDAVSAVLLTATGSTFCSGIDLTEAQTAETSQRLIELLTLIMDYPKPVVTRLNGHVRAGGIGLVATSDIVIAPRSATFAFTEVRVGVAPAMIAVPCLRVMTQRSVARLMLTGDPFDAAEAMDAGLVTHAVADDELDAATERVLTSLRLVEPHAVAATKALLRTLPRLGIAEGYAHAADVSAGLFASPEAAEGIQSFREKRPPSWAR